MTDEGDRQSESGINFSLRGLGRETERRRTEVVFIDENSSSYPYADFVDFNRGIKPAIGSIASSDAQTATEESRDKKINSIREAGRVFGRLFNLGTRGELMEVGWGGNRYFAEGIYDQSQIPLTMLDSHGFMRSSDHELSKQVKVGRSRFDTPPENAFRSGKVKLYEGDIYNLGSMSEFADKKFGTILFNGSLFGSGMNVTVQQRSIDALGRQMGQARVDADVVDKYPDHILGVTRDHLSDTGVLIVTSDRYSLYTARRDESELPEEKLQFLSLIAKSISLGAKKVTIVGITSDGTRSIISHEFGSAILEQLVNGVDALDSDTESDYLSSNRIREVKSLASGLIPSGVGLIDAVGIEF